MYVDADAVSANELRVYFRALINNSLHGNLAKIGATERWIDIFLKVAQAVSEETRDYLRRRINGDGDRAVLRLARIINAVKSAISRARHESTSRLEITFFFSSLRS